MYCLTCLESKNYITRKKVPLECRKNRIHASIESSVKYCVLQRKKYVDKDLQYLEFTYQQKCNCNGCEADFCEQSFPNTNFTICKDGVCTDPYNRDM